MERIGFIGAGRVVKIILGGLKRKLGRLPTVYLTDRNKEAVDKLKQSFEEVEVFSNALEVVKRSDVLFLAIPYTALEEVLHEIKDTLREDQLLIYLGPKYKISFISEFLNGHQKIAV